MCPKGGPGIFFSGVAMAKASTAPSITFPERTVLQETIIKLIDSPNKKRATKLGSRREIIWEEEGDQQEGPQEDNEGRGRTPSTYIICISVHN